MSNEEVMIKLHQLQRSLHQINDRLTQLELHQKESEQRIRDLEILVTPQSGGDK